MNDEFDKLLSSISRTNKIGHAFLFEVDDDYSTDKAICFIKKILEKDIDDKSKLEDIYIRIDNNVFEDIKIISSSDDTIKKEQIIELKSEFKNKSLNFGKRFYIIEYAEHLNSAAANSLLKFLEEPDDEIVAILITKNIHSVLETIISRCQIVNLNRYITHVDNDTLSEALKYIKIYENNGYKAVAYLSELYNLKAENIKKYIDSWLIIYKNVLNVLLNKEVSNDSDFIVDYKEIADKNKIETIIEKIKKVEKMEKLINSNVNVRVILDQLFID
ncbi:MAG: hypothetical protein ACI4OG_02430 [Bacilli bacterium]